MQGEVIPQFCDNDEITRTLHDLPERGQVAMLRAQYRGQPMVLRRFR